MGSNRYAPHLCASLNRTNANQMMNQSKPDSLEITIIRIGADHQTSSPTDAPETFSCPLLHACAQKIRILRPLGAAVGSRGGGPWDSNWLNWAGPWAGLWTTEPEIFEPKGLWGDISLPTCMLSHSDRSNDLRLGRIPPPSTHIFCLG